MSKTVNRVTLLGQLGRDAETKFTPSGKAVTNFSIATEHSYKDTAGDYKKDVCWHNIVMWGAEKLASYLTKGSKIYLEGRLSTRSYEDKNGDKKYVTEVIADSSAVVVCSVKQVDQDSTGYAGSHDDGADVPF